MITNKDIRVENGFLIINGDKYPLDGQSPEAIMQIVEDNSDTTPTENSDAPITSGGVYTALGTKQDTLTFDSAPTDASTNPVTSGGVFTALGTKQDTLTFDSAPTDSSTNPVTSGGVFSALAPILLQLSFQLYNPTYSDWNDFPTNSFGYGVTGQNNSPGKNSFVICFGIDTGSSPVKIQIAFAGDCSQQKYRCFIVDTWSAWTAF